MIWWLKIRATPALTAGLVGTLAVGLLVGSSELPVPALAGQAGQFLVGHLITLVPAVLLMYGTGRGDLRAESVACRPTRRWDVALGLAVAAVGLAAATLCHLLWSSDIAVVLGRNIGGYIGMALFLHPLVGHRAAGAILAAIPLLCAAAGWGPGGQPEPWAWLLHPSDSLLGVTLAAVTLAAGVTMALTRQQPLWDINSIR
ncbi:hypothetical protein [Streptomyces sp. NPDC020681]|uniref:hypothetical protein n=1 Tax=Streptomyces sp. NPDC020681 TaxID=3365083 RepID=UPI0037ADE472